MENLARVGRTFELDQIQANSSQLKPTRANSSQVGGQTIPNSIAAVNLARGECRLARAVVTAMRVRTDFGRVQNFTRVDENEFSFDCAVRERTRADEE